MSLEDLRPKTLKIIGRRYKINYPEELDGLLGRCAVDDNVIDVRDGQPDIEEADSLLHEVLHAVHHLMDIDLSPKQEETIVRRTATALIQIFVDNPKFLTYLANAR